MTLFSYRVRYDTGAAPNPFWGTCTLFICKPSIRRTAVSGDWVVGTGPSNSPAGDLSERVVYAMRVGHKLTMAEYDEWAATACPGKRPDPGHPDPRRAVGDAVYNFAYDPPAVRPSVHNEKHRDRDLGGRYALLSDRFVYFGRAAAELPVELRPLVRRGQGHQSVSNAPLAAPFIRWLEALGHPWGSVLADPCEGLAAPLTQDQGRACRTPHQALQQIAGASTLSVTTTRRGPRGC